MSCNGVRILRSQFIYLCLQIMQEMRESGSSCSFNTTSPTVKVKKLMYVYILIMPCFCINIEHLYIIFCILLIARYVTVKYLCIYVYV